MKKLVLPLTICMLCGCNDGVQFAKSNSYTTYDSFVGAVEKMQMAREETQAYIFDFDNEIIESKLYFIDGITDKKHEKDDHYLLYRQYYVKASFTDTSYAYIIYRDATSFDKESLVWVEGRQGAYNYQKYYDHVDSTFQSSDFYLSDKDNKVIVSMSFNHFSEEDEKNAMFDYIKSIV